MKEGFEKKTSVIEKDLASEFDGIFSAGIDAARKENVMAKKKAELLKLQDEKIAKLKKDLEEKKVSKASDYTINSIDIDGLSKDEAKEVAVLKDRINKAILKIGEPKKADDTEKAKVAKKTPDPAKKTVAPVIKPIEDETAEPSVEKVSESVADDNETLSVKADSPFALDADGSMTTLGEAGFKKIEEDKNDNEIDGEEASMAKENSIGKKPKIQELKSEIEELRRRNTEKKYNKEPKSEYEIKDDSEENLKTKLRYVEEADLRTDRRNNPDMLILDMDKAKEQYEQTLKSYAEIEYKHRSTFKGMAKFFGKFFKESADDLPEVKDERKRMEDDLRVYRDAWIRDIENKNLGNDEMKSEVEKMLVYFNYQAAIDLYDARSCAKANSLWPSNGNDEKFGKDIPNNYGDFNISDSYAKREKAEISIKDVLCMPFKATWAGMEKLGQQYDRLPIWAKLGLGAAIFSSGSWALIAGKRILGGAVTAVGSAKTLDALHQNSMKNKADSENLEFMKSKEGVDKGIDFEKLRNLLDDKIGQVDEKMNQYRVASLFNKFAGFGIGALLGSGAASKAFAGGIEYFQNSAVGGSLKNVFNSALTSVNLETPLTNSFEHVGSLPVEHISNAEITVNSGSSIEKSLIEYLKANHLADIDDPGEAAHVMVQDYAKAHGIPYEKLNHILPGTHFTVDPNTHQIVNMDVKFMAENEHLSSVVAQEVPIEESGKIVEGNLLTADNGDIAENSQSVEQLQKGVAELDAKYRTEIGEMSSAADGVDEASHRDMVNEIDKDREVLKQQLIKESGFADKLKTEAFNMRKELASGNPSTWNEIKNLNYQQASSEPEIRSKLEKLAKLYRKDIGPNGIEPRSNETLEHWTWRVAGSALKRRLKIEHE